MAFGQVQTSARPPGQASAMRQLAAACSRLLVLVAILLATAAYSDARALKIFRSAEIAVSYSKSDAYCGPHCSCLHNTSTGHSFCGGCEPGYEPPQGPISSCDATPCPLHCLQCNSNGCLQCEPGYTALPSYREAACLPERQSSLFASVHDLGPEEKAQLEGNKFLPQESIDDKSTQSIFRLLCHWQPWCIVLLIPWLVSPNLRRMSSRYVPQCQKMLWPSHLETSTQAVLPPLLNNPPAEHYDSPNQRLDGEECAPMGNLERLRLLPHQSEGATLAEEDMGGDIELIETPFGSGSAGPSRQMSKKAAATVPFSAVGQESGGGSESRETVPAIPMEDRTGWHCYVSPEDLKQQLVVQEGATQSSDPSTSATAERDSEDRSSQISLDEVLQQLNGIRYNLNIMQFLKEQMENAKGLALLKDMSEGSSQQLDVALKQGARLIDKHSRPFDIKLFYRIEDARRAAQLVCQRMFEALAEHSPQIERQVPQECIDEDRRHLYAHLGYILMGRQCDFANEDGFQREWESLRRWHEVHMRELNVIVESDLVVGQARGQGGFGQVYEGTWRRESVAIKKVNSVDAAADLSMEEFAGVFKEASTLASLNHPHVVRLYGMTKSGWMIMELADGDFSSLCACAPLAWSTTLDVLLQAANALEYVHCRQHPLVHGDIKDTNFLYTKMGNGVYDVKLADFGLTTEVRNWHSTTMRPAAATALWKAPELHDGQNPSLEADVFSFGLVMHAVVTGQQPYGSRTNECVVMRKKLDGVPPCIVWERHCPRELCDLMGRCVARAPRDRPTMCEVAECLSKLPRDWQAGH